MSVNLQEILNSIMNSLISAFMLAAQVSLFVTVIMVGLAPIKAIYKAKVKKGEATVTGGGEKVG